jgi:CRISPR-associated endonuclease/helicase Cas3
MPLVHHGPFRGVVDIPTGLGKAMALWLSVVAVGAKLPGRLTYVVDRRTLTRVSRLLPRQSAGLHVQPAPPDPDRWSPG